MTLDSSTQDEIREYLEREDNNTDVSILLLDQNSMI